MTTKREYLKSQGITVGARGRFSGAAKVAIEEALKKGITFTAEKPQPKRAAKQQIWGLVLPGPTIFGIMAGQLNKGAE